MDKAVRLLQLFVKKSCFWVGEICKCPRANPRGFPTAVRGCNSWLLQLDSIMSLPSALLHLDPTFTGSFFVCGRPASSVPKTGSAVSRTRGFSLTEDGILELPDISQQSFPGVSQRSPESARCRTLINLVPRLSSITLLRFVHRKHRKQFYIRLALVIPMLDSKSLSTE